MQLQSYLVKEEVPEQSWEFTPANTLGYLISSPFFSSVAYFRSVVLIDTEELPFYCLFLATGYPALSTKECCFEQNSS